MSLGGYLSILTLSFRSSSIKFISELLGAKDFKSINQVFNTSIIIYFLFGCFLALYNLLFGIWGIDYFSIPSSHLWKAKSLFYFNAVFSLFNIPLSITVSYFHAVQKNIYSSILQFLKNVTYGISILIIVFLNENVIFLFVSQMIFGLLIDGISFILLMRQFDYLSLKLKDFSKPYFEKMFNYSSWMFLWALATTLIYQTDQIIIGIFLPVSTITYYQIASKLHNIVKMIDGYVGVPITPSVSSAIGANDIIFIEKVKYIGLKFVLFIIMPLVTVFILYADQIISIWIGIEYAKYSTGATQLFLIYWYFGIIVFFVGRLLQAHGIVKEFSLIFILGAIINIILSVVFVREMGLIGVVLATVVQFILLTPFSIRIFSRELNLSFKKIIQNTIQIYLINFFIGILLYVVQLQFSISTLTVLISVMCLSFSLIYAIQFLFLTSDEKEYIRKFIKNSLQRFKTISNNSK